MAPNQPPRKKMRRREIPGGSRFLTFSCQRRLPLFSNPRIANLFVEALAAARTKYSLEIFAWVVMPEHVHILCRPPSDVPLQRVLRSIKMAVTKPVIERWKRLRAPILERISDATGRPRFWQKGGGHDRNIRDAAEFSRKVQYIHRNPVERGLVDNPEDWRWSSLRWWMGRREHELECDAPPFRSARDPSWKGFM